MQELYLDNHNSLIDEEEWKIRISGIKKSCDSLGILGKDEAIIRLKNDLVSAVKKRIPKARFGIMLSGGVDSSTITFLCRKFGHDFPCYTSSFGSSKDLASAKEAAKMLDLDLRIIDHSLDELDSVFSEVARIIPNPNVVNVGVGSVVLTAGKLAKKEGVSFLFTGLGSEEIFAGYQRHELANDINLECWRGLEGMWSRDLKRDCAISAFLGVEFLTPFLDEKMIYSAMCVPGFLKINELGKKVILSEVSADLGLPKEIAFRKKIAAQYGSAFDAAMEKLTKKKGFKSKQKYVESLA